MHSLQNWEEMSRKPQYLKNSKTTKNSNNNNTNLEGKYSLESTDPHESEIRAHLQP